MSPKRMNPPSAGLEVFVKRRMPAPPLSIIHEYQPDLAGVTFTPTLEEKVLYYSPRPCTDAPPVLDVDSGKVIREDHHDEGYETESEDNGPRRKLSDASREKRRIVRAGDTLSDRRHSYPLDVDFELPTKIKRAPVPGPNDPPLQTQWSRAEPPLTRRSYPAVGLGITADDFQLPGSSRISNGKEAVRDQNDLHDEDVILYIHHSH